MSFVLVSHYLRAMGHSAKKKKRGEKPKSLCRENGGCLFVQCDRLGQKEGKCRKFPSRGTCRENEISWVPSAPWDTQNWILKVTYGISYCCCDLCAESWVLAFG